VTREEIEQRFKELGFLTIPDEYLPEGVSGATWDPFMLRLIAQLHSEHPWSHTLTTKAWVVAWLLDEWVSLQEMNKQYKAERDHFERQLTKMEETRANTR
jgi:hypothetical protein